jgi:hypothetical protein
MGRWGRSSKRCEYVCRELDGEFSLIFRNAHVHVFDGFEFGPSAALKLNCERKVYVLRKKGR